DDWVRTAPGRDGARTALLFRDCGRAAGDARAGRAGGGHLDASRTQGCADRGIVMDSAEQSQELMLMLGMSLMTSVTTLPPIAKKRLRFLVRMFMFQTETAEKRNEAGEQATLAHASRLALLVALRVLLHPDNRELLIREAQRSADEGR